MIVWRCLLVCGPLLMLSLEGQAMHRDSMEALYAAADAYAHAHRFWGEDLVGLFAQYDATRGPIEVDVKATYRLLEGTRSIDQENLPDLFAQKFGDEGTFYTARTGAYHLYMHCRDARLPLGGVLRRTVYEKAQERVLMFWEHADEWGDITGIFEVGMLPAAGMLGSRLPLSTKTRQALGFSHQEIKVFRAVSNLRVEAISSGSREAESESSSAHAAAATPHSPRARLIARIEELSNSKGARALVRAVREAVLAKRPEVRSAIEALQNAPFDSWRREILKLYQDLPSGRTEIAERLLKTPAFLEAAQR